MIEEILEQHPKCLWIRIDQDQLQWMNHDGSIRKTQLPKQPYHHPRTFFADYPPALEALNELLKDLSNWQKSWVPVLALQVMEAPAGGLTAIELRALRELAYEAGIPNIIIYDRDGQPLTEEPMKVINMRQLMRWLKILLVLIILVVIAVNWYFTL